MKLEKNFLIEKVYKWGFKFIEFDRVGCGGGIEEGLMNKIKIIEKKLIDFYIKFNFYLFRVPWVYFY